MRKIFVLALLSLLLAFVSCKVEDLVSELGSAVITAKTKIGEVLNKAKSDFAPDAQLAAIYGWNVNSEGQVDLQKTTENAFVYVVQSDASQSNEFYVPVYNSSPVKSPINFNNMLALIKNNNAKNIMEQLFGKLATINVDPSASYDDSPQVLSKMLVRNDVMTFRTNNSGSKIDMFLLPGKSIDTTSVSNAADWIVNFYADTSSLVLWLHTDNGVIKNLNDL